MVKSQNKWVLQRLNQYGRVTRNQALKNQISRLASRILDVKPILKEQGKEILANSVKTKNGRDYEYRLVTK